MTGDVREKKEEIKNKYISINESIYIYQIYQIYTSINWSESIHLLGLWLLVASLDAVPTHYRLLRLKGVLGLFLWRFDPLVLANQLKSVEDLKRRESGVKRLVL